MEKITNEQYHDVAREMAEERIHFFLKQMEYEPYAFNRSEDEVREYLWIMDTGWQKSEINPDGIAYEEYIDMWNYAREDYYIREYISKERAMGFYKDLKGVLYNGDVNHVDTCSITVEGAAELLGIDMDTVRVFYLALKVHRITERQGRGLVF